MDSATSSELMLRSIAIPQCWGHDEADGLRHAQKHPGVNVNLLAGDGPENIERLSGMSHLSGILVHVRKPETPELSYSIEHMEEEKAAGAE